MTVSQLFAKQALSSWFGYSNHQHFLNSYFLLICNLWCITVTKYHPQLQQTENRCMAYESSELGRLIDWPKRTLHIPLYITSTDAFSQISSVVQNISAHSGNARHTYAEFPRKSKQLQCLVVLLSQLYWTLSDVNIHCHKNTNIETDAQSNYKLVWGHQKFDQMYSTNIFH